MPPPSAEEIAEEIAQLLAQNPTFTDLPHEDRDALAAAADVREVAAGEAIFRRGEAGSSLYVVIGGRVRVSLEGPAGEEEVSLLGPGDFFGEIALLTRSHRTATITAVEASRLLHLPADAVLPLAERHPTFREKLGRTGARRSQESMKRLLGE